jgi:hypothetical protein
MQKRMVSSPGDVGVVDEARGRAETRPRKTSNSWTKTWSTVTKNLISSGSGKLARRKRAPRRFHPHVWRGERRRQGMTRTNSGEEFHGGYLKNFLNFN